MLQVSLVLAAALGLLPTSGPGEPPARLGGHGNGDAIQLSALLSSAIESADRVTVFEEDHVAKRSKVLFTSSDRIDLGDLQKALRVLPADGLCACIPTLYIRLYRSDEEAASIGYLGDRLHVTGWAGDAELISRDALLHWFEDRGMEGPRKEAQDEKSRAKRALESEKRWVAAMPMSLRPFWIREGQQIRASGDTPELDPWRSALQGQFPIAQDQIRALLIWFGSGDGPWSGYPAYEAIAEELLYDYPINELVTAIENGLGDERQREGGSRLLAGLRRDRTEDLDLVPPSLKEALLTYSLRSRDKDKRQRAEVAFGR